MRKYQKLSTYFRENRIGQQEVADLIGVTRPTLNRKLNGPGDFTLTEIITICKHFKISADEYVM